MDQQYLKVLNYILENGIDNANDRTGHGRRRVFGIQERFDISEGKFPLVTTRKLNPMLPIVETCMFLSGQTNVSYLHEHGLKIWDKWALSKESVQRYFETLIERGMIEPQQAGYLMGSVDPLMLGDIGPMYGAMWRDFPRLDQNIHMLEATATVDDLPSDRAPLWRKAWEGFSEEEKASAPLDQFLLRNYYSTTDQINELIRNLKRDPYGSRHLVTAFNPSLNPIEGFDPDVQMLMGKGSLMACHAFFQVFVKPPKEEGGKKRLSLQFYMRSADVPVGSVANIAGYGFLAHALAHCLDMDADELIYTVGDAHIYLDQIEGVKEQIAREPRAVPTIRINPEKRDIFQITPADVIVDGYDPHPAIKYPVAK